MYIVQPIHFLKVDYYCITRKKTTLQEDQECQDRFRFILMYYFLTFCVISTFSKLMFTNWRVGMSVLALNFENSAYDLPVHLFHFD